MTEIVLASWSDLGPYFFSFLAQASLALLLTVIQEIKFVEKGVSIVIDSSSVGKGSISRVIVNVSNSR